MKRVVKLCSVMLECTMPHSAQPPKNPRYTCINVVCRWCAHNEPEWHPKTQEWKIMNRKEKGCWWVNAEEYWWKLYKELMLFALLSGNAVCRFWWIRNNGKIGRQTKEIDFFDSKDLISSLLVIHILIVWAVTELFKVWEADVSTIWTSRQFFREWAERELISFTWRWRGRWGWIRGRQTWWWQAGACENWGCWLRHSWVGHLCQ